MIKKPEKHSSDEHYLTVGKLKKLLEECNLPDDAPVIYEVIPDIYFKEHNWDKSVFKVPDPSWDYENDYVQAFDAWKNDNHLLLSAHY